MVGSLVGVAADGSVGSLVAVGSEDGDVGAAGWDGSLVDVGCGRAADVGCGSVGDGATCGLGEAGEEYRYVGVADAVPYGPAVEVG